MEGNVPVPGWNAHRKAQAPLRQPNYVFSEVPKCKKDLEGSVLQRIENRDHLKVSMAEMAMLCTEAMRRTSANRCSSKPLSLEYIADRLDVDDPCLGYTVRSKEGMLQGFITWTTFTNWQKSFRWDSLNETAFNYDDSDSEDEDGVRHRPQRARRVDRDGSLAQALQQTVRMGDPYDEGVVWPRIAEISLLGGLGCGRKLVQLAIEHLEFRKASDSSNYEYIALQATDNSIPFYESLGFIRVGAVTFDKEGPKEQDPNPPNGSEHATEEVQAAPLPPSSPDKPDTVALPSAVVMSPFTTLKIKRGGILAKDVAKKHKVNIWDLIFLNRDNYDIFPSSRLLKGTILRIPKQEPPQTRKEIPSTKWFMAKENDTPRKIAKKFELPCKALVEANLHRLPELTALSRLKAGTRVKVSNLDLRDEISTPYCHWSFPDDSTVEGGEPSYMMVYKLQKASSRSRRVVQDSLAVPIDKYTPPEVLLPVPTSQPQETRIRLPPAPKRPKGPTLAMDIFRGHMRELYPELSDRTSENDRILKEKWDAMAQSKKDRYNAVATETNKPFIAQMEEYEVEYSLWEEECANAKPTPVPEKVASLFNKVVKLRNDALEGKEYQYWFVLTYIPDLKWCHLAPMVQDGVFGPERKRSQGRPRWRLVEEKFAKELDISSMFCIPVKSKTLKKTADADKEEWDIIDPESGSGNQPSDGSVGNPVTPVSRPIRKQPIRARSAIKPLSGKIAITKPKTGPSQEIKRVTPSSPLRPQSKPPASQSMPRELRPSFTSPKKPPPSPLPRSSPRLTVKRKSSEDLDPTRKVRRVNNTGARRSVLQS